jgi:hypothetical protein
VNRAAAGGLVLTRLAGSFAQRPDTQHRTTHVTGATLPLHSSLTEPGDLLTPALVNCHVRLPLPRWTPDTE